MNYDTGSSAPVPAAVLTASVSAAPVVGESTLRFEERFDGRRLEIAGHCVGVCLLGGLVLWGLKAEPPVRGFFCDDSSIRFPLSSETVPVAPATVLVLGLPLALVVAGEWLQRSLLRLQRRGGVGPCAEERKMKKRKCLSLDCSLESPLAPLGRVLYGLAFSLLFSLALATVAKVCVGRLRPHFLSACDPDMTGVKCKDANGLPILVETYKCKNPNAHVVREARLSFFSAHSSNAFAAAVFTVVYIQLRFRARPLVVDECWCGLCSERANTGPCAGGEVVETIQIESTSLPPPPTLPAQQQLHSLDAPGSSVLVTYVPPKRRRRRRSSKHPLTPSAIAFLRGAAPFLQTVLLLLATFIALSRVLDYFHHPSDVAVGIGVGTVSGLFSALCVAKLQRLSSNV